MTPRAHLPLEHELLALKAEIRLTARRLKDVTRSLRRPQPRKPALRLLRGGLWRPER